MLSLPPFPCQFTLYPLFTARLGLGSRLRLCNGLRFLDHFFYLPRPSKAGAGQISGQPQLLRKIFLPDKWRSLLTERIGDFLSPPGEGAPGDRSETLPGVPSPSFINNRIARIKCWVEISTFRSLKIWAIR